MASNLYTLDFTYNDVQSIASVLFRKFELWPEIKRYSTKTQWYLHFDRVQTALLIDLIRDTLKEIPSLAYKLVPRSILAP